MWLNGGLGERAHQAPGTRPDRNAPTLSIYYDPAGTWTVPSTCDMVTSVPTCSGNFDLLSGLGEGVWDPMEASNRLKSKEVSEWAAQQAVTNEELGSDAEDTALPANLLCSTPLSPTDRGTV